MVLPPLSDITLGDLLDQRRVNWAWYADLWNAAASDGTQAPSVGRSVIYALNGGYEPHRSPFNFYATFDPGTHAEYRATHLRDAEDLMRDAQHGALPSVSFYRPSSNYSESRGVRSLQEGDAHVGELIDVLRGSAQWKNMVIIVTWDQGGGTWDHAAPPQGDLLGPGLRVPTLLISPFAKKGRGPHTDGLRLNSEILDPSLRAGAASRLGAAGSGGAGTFKAGFW